MNSIGIIGGGVAGYLSALAFRKFFPEAKITLIESDRIPIIGVGEATTPPLVDFLHRILDFDVKEFYREVQPTHKMGIRFEWGLKAPYYFNYPFEPQDIYLAKEINKDVTLSCLQSVLMNDGRSFIIEKDGRYDSISTIFEKGNYAYHLDNKKFVSYLKRKAEEREIHHLFDTVREVDLDSEKKKIASLKLNSGNEVGFDFYVDCTGFSSLLLEKSLQTAYIDYSSSLFTNAALTATIPNKSAIPPYTSAITMKNGWLWHIPLRDSIHIGYVFSDSFTSEAQVREELLQKHPDAEKMKSLTFRSGRHAASFSGNVLAIGNAFGFVEPLESTGLHMIVSTLKAFAEIFKTREFTGSNYSRFNEIINDKWDQLKWFLALHYKFNQRLNTPFWEANRAKVDASGYANLIELMRKEGPLRQEKHMKNSTIRKQIQNSLIKFSGLDTFLVAQDILPEKVNDKFTALNRKQFSAKLAIWNAVSKHAVPHRRALELIEQQPFILK